MYTAGHTHFKKSFCNIMLRPYDSNVPQKIPNVLFHSTCGTSCHCYNQDPFMTIRKKKFYGSIKPTMVVRVKGQFYRKKV